MTRTKNRVYFIAPEKNPSEFLLEIKKEYKNVYRRGQWSEEEQVMIGKRTCPICGFPLQLKYKPSYGLRLYICTNEPEICDFMTNNLRGKKLSIMKCTDCYEGYLIVKTPKNGAQCFLGCSNYKSNGHGCNGTLSMREYYKMMKYDPSEIDKASYLVRILYGSSNQRVLQDELNLIPEYGSLAYLDRGDIRKVVDWLVDKHYILKTKGKYPVLHITNEGLYYKDHMTPRNMKSLVDLLNEATEDVKKQGKSKANAGVKWSEEEDDKLDREFASGMSIEEIAKEHERSYGEIRARLVKHGVIEE